MSSYHNRYEEEADEAKEEKRLMKMSVAELKDELEKRFKEKLVKRIKLLDQDIDAIIERNAFEIIFAALGVKHDRYGDGKWEVDKANGFKSKMAQALAEHAQEQIQLAVPDFLEELTKPVAMPAWKSALQKEYREELASAMRLKLDEAAKEAAEQHSSELVSELKKQLGMKAPHFVDATNEEELPDYSGGIEL